MDVFDLDYLYFSSRRISLSSIINLNRSLFYIAVPSFSLKSVSLNKSIIVVYVDSGRSPWQKTFYI